MQKAKAEAAYGKTYATYSTAHNYRVFFPPEVDSQNEKTNVEALTQPYAKCYV